MRGSLGRLHQAMYNFEENFCICPQFRNQGQTTTPCEKCVGFLIANQYRENVRDGTL